QQDLRLQTGGQRMSKVHHKALRDSDHPGNSEGYRLSIPYQTLHGGNMAALGLPATTGLAYQHAAVRQEHRAHHTRRQTFGEGHNRTLLSSVLHFFGADA